jgi:hypothetical protein
MFSLESLAESVYFPERKSWQLTPVVLGTIPGSSRLSSPSLQSETQEPDLVTQVCLLKLMFTCEKGNASLGNPIWITVYPKWDSSRFYSFYADECEDIALKYATNVSFHVLSR